MIHTIRKAVREDLPQIFAIYKEARKFMAENGNAGQWGSDKPPAPVLEQNVEDGDLYVLDEDGELRCVFFFAAGPDPTYAFIEDGAWLAHGPYGVIHRIASAGKRKGAASECIRWAMTQCEDLRLDTHRNNIPMQSLLSKLGFTRCGIIYLEDGDPRIAYQILTGRKERNDASV